MTDRDDRKALAVGLGGKVAASPLGALGLVLDTSGADSLRWPAVDRDRLLRLAEESSEAKAMIAEVKAFESVLAVAPGSGARSTGTLAELIVATARSTPRLATTGAVPVITGVGSVPVRRMALTARWREASLLAASLLLGITVGTSETVGNYVRTVAAEIGVASEVPIAGLEDLWDTSDISEGIL